MSTKLVAIQNVFGASIFYGCLRRENKTEVNLNWSRSFFSKFSFDLLFGLEGRNDKKPYLTGSYAKVIDSPKLKPALEQKELIPGEPFLSIAISRTENNQYSIAIENVTDIDAIGSLDNFKSETIPFATKVPVTLICTQTELSPLRLLYKATNGNGEIFYLLMNFASE